MKPNASILHLTFWVGLPCASLAAPTARDVTFLSASDPHYRQPDHRLGCHNDLNRASVEEMNRIAGLAWPEKLGADPIGKPRGVVMLMGHCGFDTDWWVAADWAEFYQAIKPYNVVLYLYGHSGTGVSAWAPAGEEKKLTCINDGQATTGFFVIHISADHLRAPYRFKSGINNSKTPDGKEQHAWDGRWEWKWLLDKKLEPAR